MKKLLSSPLTAPRQLKNLVLYPALFASTFLILTVGRYTNILITLLFIFMFAEATLSISSQKYDFKSSDFRDIWAAYKFRIRYLVSLCFSYCAAAALYKFVGFYSVFFYVISFYIFRLYSFEATKLAEEKNRISPSLQLISQSSDPQSSLASLGVIKSLSRSQNLKKFKSVICNTSVDEIFKRKLIQKAEFSSWFSSSVFEEQAKSILSHSFLELPPEVQKKQLIEIESLL